MTAFWILFEMLLGTKFLSSLKSFGLSKINILFSINYVAAIEWLYGFTTFFVAIKSQTVVFNSSFFVVAIVLMLLSIFSSISTGLILFAQIRFFVAIMIQFLLPFERNTIIIIFTMTIMIFVVKRKEIFVICSNSSKTGFINLHLKGF